MKQIKPYKFEGRWFFDDEQVGLVKEELVGGADDLADQVSSFIPNAEDGFCLNFDKEEFPNYQLKLDWVREEIEGDSYILKEMDQEVWLCPALLKYFKSPPEELYLQVKEIE